MEAVHNPLSFSISVEHNFAPSSHPRLFSFLRHIRDFFSLLRHTREFFFASPSHPRIFFRFSVTSANFFIFSATSANFFRFSVTPANFFSLLRHIRDLFSFLRHIREFFSFHRHVCQFFRVVLFLLYWKAFYGLRWKWRQIPSLRRVEYITCIYSTEWGTKKDPPDQCFMIFYHFCTKIFWHLNYTILVDYRKPALIELCYFILLLEILEFLNKQYFQIISKCRHISQF